MAINPESGTDLLQTGEVARWLNVSPTTIHQWVRSGQLVALKTGRNVLLFRREDVERFVAAREARRAGSSLETAAVRT